MGSGQLLPGPQALKELDAPALRGAGEPFPWYWRSRTRVETEALYRTSARAYVPSKMLPQTISTFDFVVGLDVLRNPVSKDAGHENSARLPAMCPLIWGLITKSLPTTMRCSTSTLCLAYPMLKCGGSFADTERQTAHRKDTSATARPHRDQRKRAVLRARALHASVSSQIVTGPSLISATAISAPKRPCATGMSFRRKKPRRAG